jgi:hypothetical protein
MSNTSPTRLATERQMTKQPLAVDSVKGQKLDGLSRVNFDKVYTVEHNIKVMDIGRISQTSMPKLISYWKIENK